MTPVKFATHSLAPRDQLEAWRGWFHSVFDVIPRQSADRGFAAESQTWAIDGLALSRVLAPPIRAARTKVLIRRNPVDHWVITRGHRVTTTLGTDNTSLQAPAGMPFILSLGDEFVSERNTDERLHLYLARDTFREIAPLLDAARGMVLNTPLGSLLGDYIAMLERHFSDLAADDQRRLTSAISAMVGACVLPSSDRMAVASGQIDLGRLERVRRAVRKHLRSPALAANTLCRLVGTSRSQLYRLLEGEGGVARYIQRQRLLDAYAALSEVSNVKAIAAIAEELCFADASTFSRAFRQEFGMSPSDVRGAARVGLAPVAMPKDRIGAENRSLRDCLRAF